MYKRCCLDRDRDAERAARDLIPGLRQEAQEQMERTSKRLRDEYGVLINYVAPVEWQGRRVWALGSRVYPDRPATETFHEFLLHVLRGVFGEDWRAAQAALPPDERHFVKRCFEKYEEWTEALRTPENQEGEARWAAEPSGWVQYLISLAWDAATLIHAADLPDTLVNRLRDPVAFQGARYEVAVAAIYARLDCSIQFLDEDERLRSAKHAEFIATHRPTQTEIAVEAKSRHRAGVLNEDGEPSEDDPLRGDARAVRRLFTKALEKAPDGMPFMIFIDINAPLDRDHGGFDSQWRRDVAPRPVHRTPRWIVA